MSGVVLVSATTASYGQIVLSEVLSNEPAGRVRLEWIEIYNQSDIEADLGNFVLIADSDTNYLPAGIFINPNSCAVLARQAEPDNGFDSFEGYWGDSSGVWGDSPIEDYLLLDITISLNNASGSVVLANYSLNVIDSVSWTSASDDGRSIERTDVEDVISGWHDCFDSDGSTPGRANSLIPVEGENGFQVNIDPVSLSRRSFDSNEFQIDTIIPPGTRLSIRIYDETGYEVRSLMENSETAVSTLFWNGKDKSDSILPPGLYIISFDLTGQKDDSKYRALVIAP